MRSQLLYQLSELKSSSSKNALPLNVPFKTVDVNVLFDNVSALSNNETVPVVASNKVIVLSAVESVTVNVVSFASFVDPSNTIELSVNVKPETFVDVIVLFVKV